MTIHRFSCVDKDKLAMWITPGSRHLGAFFDEYCQRGEDMPISISIGLDPAVYMCCGFEAPTTPLGFNELQIAGALRGHAVELADCITVPQKCIANAEYVLEGYLMHDETINEDVNGHGYAMPEFPGYTGGAKVCPVIKITAVTTRVNPIMESCIGPSHEHVSMAGIPTEASIYKMSRPLSRAACSTFTPPPAAAASSLPSCSSRSRAKMTRAVSATPPCSPSRHSPSSST